MSAQFFHVGPYAKNVGCRTPQGEPLWDGDEERRRAWADAQAAVFQSPPKALADLLSCADRADSARSHFALDQIERELLGRLVTGGSFPKRSRFWRFVRYISRGITPRDLIPVKIAPTEEEPWKSAFIVSMKAWIAANRIAPRDGRS